MGFRFRKTVRVAPGIRLNISKSGVSTSLGGRGASVNIGPRGVRQTVGIPGTGLAFSSLATKGGGGEASNGIGGKGSGCLGLVLILGLLVMLGQCLGGEETAPDRREATAASVAEAGASQGLFSAPGDGVTSIDAGADTDAGAAGAGTGETVYVQSSALNARTGPSTDAAVVEKLSRGTSLQVVERSGDWTKVAQGATMFWIASRHVGSTRPARQASPAAARPKKRTSGSGISGGCSCSGGNVCIGPRGGRYCIISGGHKRYGV